MQRVRSLKVNQSYWQRLFIPLQDRFVRRVGLFLSSFFLVLFSHLGLMHLAAMAAPNTNIVALINYTPASNVNPADPVAYTITLRNNDVSGNPATITSFSHTLPSTPGNIIFGATTPTSDSCGTNIAITPGTPGGTPGSFTITSGTIPAPSSGDPGECVITIPAQGFAEGNHNDDLLAGALKTTLGDTAQDASASVQIVESSPATLNKKFEPNTIPGGGRAIATVTVNNPNDFDLTGVSLADALPAGLIVDQRTGAPAATTDCDDSSGTTATATITATDTVTLTGAKVQTKSSCNFTFPVTTNTGGSYTNEIAANALSTDQFISNDQPVSANLNVQTTVTLAKDMTATLLYEGDSTALKITISNGGAKLTNVTLTDPLPAPLVVANTTATTTCTSDNSSKTLTVTTNANNFTLNNTNVVGSNAEVPASDPNTNSLGTCEINVTVKADPSQNYDNNVNKNSPITNTVSGLTSTEGRTEEAPASDQLNVQPALVATKSYTDNNKISPGNTARVTITITNRSSAINATGVSFTDALPTGLTVANPPQLDASRCTGTVTNGSGGALSAGDTSIQLNSGTINAGDSCIIEVDLTTSNTSGSFLNVIDDDTITNNENLDSDGVTDNEGELTIVEDVTVDKNFSKSTIRRGLTSKLTINIRNHQRARNGDPDLILHNVTITDDLPTNLQVATPVNFQINGSCISPTSGAPSYEDTSYTLTGVTINELTTCTVSFNVEEISRDNGAFPTPIEYDNITSNFNSDEISPTPSNPIEGSATLKVISPLGGEKEFQSPAITANGVSTAVIKLNNTAPEKLTGVSFTDDWTQSNTTIVLPTGLSFPATDPSNVSSTCGGSITLTNARIMTFSGGEVPARVGSTTGLCEVRFEVTMDGTGSRNGNAETTFTNTIPTNDVTTAEGYKNPSKLEATLTEKTTNVNIIKKVTDNSLRVGDPTTLTVDITNPNNGIALTEVGFTDAMPAGMKVYTTPSITNSCGGTVTANPGESTYTLAGGSLAINTTCSVSLQITVTDTGNQTNELPIGVIESREAVTNSQLSKATVNALASLLPGKSFSPSAVDGGIPSTLTLTIENKQTKTTNPLSNVSLTDNLPTDVYVSNPANITNNCGGNVTADPGTTVVTLTGGTLNPGATCTITLQVISPTQGSYENTLPPNSVTAELPASIGSTTVTHTNTPRATLTVNTNSAPPDMILVKRISAVNGTPITGFNDDGSSTEDNDSNWPSPTSTTLRGAHELLTTPLSAGDELEYTIYYLNKGLGSADDVMICDRVPTHTSFVPAAYNTSPPAAAGGNSGADRGIVHGVGAGTNNAENSLSNVSDGDGGYYFPPGIDPTQTLSGVNCGGTNTNGAVVIKIDGSVPPISGPSAGPEGYGYLRFTAKIN